MRILVTGATGYVGSRLIGALLDQGHDVIAATRTPRRLADFGWADRVQAVELDAADRDSVDAALAATSIEGPIDVAYYLVHGIGQPDFRNRDNAAGANFAEALKDAGVRRIVYLGGFVPDHETLSEHLAGRAEVAAALSVADGAEVVWLGAAVIIGAGSTSFEMVRYIGDRLPLIPLPSWVDHPIDPISIRDVLHYLVAAADRDRVPVGAYDIVGPNTTTYRGLLGSYVWASGSSRSGLPLAGWGEALVPKKVMAWVAGNVVPVPTGLAVDLIASLDHPMTASATLLREVVADPPGGLVTVDDAVLAATGSPGPRPVDQLADPHHLADTDPQWAGGDELRLRQLATAVPPPGDRAALGLLSVTPKPVAAAVRTGLDVLIGLLPKAVAW